MKLEIVGGNYDEAARKAFKGNPNTALSFFIVASYCYYVVYESVLSDECYDKMSRYLLQNWDKVEHVNKNLVTKDNLKAGSLYNLKESDYPTRVKVTADILIRDLLLWRNERGENQK